MYSKHNLFKSYGRYSLANQVSKTNRTPEWHSFLIAERGLQTDSSVSEIKETRKIKQEIKLRAAKTAFSR